MALTAHAARSKDLRTAEAIPELQHRHFAYIASILKSTKPPHHWDLNKLYQWLSMVASFRDELAKTNPRFNVERFLEASGADDADMYNFEHGG